MNLKQRFADWLRERRIQRLTADLLRLSGRKFSPLQIITWDRLKAEIHARSPEQIARMEARRGLR